MSDARGDGPIVRADAIATGWFVLTALAAALIFEGPILWVAALTALGLFLVGVATFLWAFWNGVQRSRDEQVAVTQLFLLLGGVAPPSVKRAMLGLLAVQVAVGLGTALARPDAADGTPGSSLALGVLVPMFGLGLNGLWAAYHGDFAMRPDVQEVRPDDTSIGQNEDHG